MVQEDSPLTVNQEATEAQGVPVKIANVPREELGEADKADKGAQVVEVETVVEAAKGVTGALADPLHILSHVTTREPLTLTLTKGAWACQAIAHHRVPEVRLDLQVRPPLRHRTLTAA